MRESRASRPTARYVSTTQTGATWGLDRVDQLNLPLTGTFTYTRTGFGVTAYVIDTGIRFDHSEFGGRAISGYDAINGGSADDRNGHGTHVSGHDRRVDVRRGEVRHPRGRTGSAAAAAARSPA